MIKSTHIAFIFFYIFLFSCETGEGHHGHSLGYTCLEDSGGCTKVIGGEFSTFEECDTACSIKANAQETIVTVFLYENCPIAQYMCGPLRDAHAYFCDSLNQGIVFRGFSPNSFSTAESLENFISKYSIPFNVVLDFNQLENTPGEYTQAYLPVVTPEVFVEFNGDLVYRGMIDNSYLALGEWALPTENYLVDVLTNIINGSELLYFETQAVGCLINY